MLKYKIIELIPDRHAVVVRFWSDEVSVTDVVTATDENGNPTRCATDVTIKLPVPPPSGAALHEFLLSRAPVQELELVRDVKSPVTDTTLSTLVPLVGQEFQGVAPVARQLIVSSVARL